jgi:hypothetical protein|uniref:Uncharacterized protein n=1 Tax=viral metagenome TaxID=1070528 RepID=A0A6C0BS12_9ZZZZ
MNKQLLISFIVICVCFYLQCYFKSPIDYYLIHSKLNTFDLNMLYEKQPIYIYDKIVNPADLLNTIFKYQYMYHMLSISNKNLTKRNLSKYVIIYNDNEEEKTKISISHPRTIVNGLSFKSSHFVKKNFNISPLLLDNSYENVIDFILKPMNCIILPLNWVYRTCSDKMIEIHLHDPITSVYSFMV